MPVYFFHDANVAFGKPAAQWPEAGSPSAVLHERARRHISAENAASLSIKCMFGGEAVYRTEGRHIRLDDTVFLLLNHAQPYSMEIDSRSTVESFCVFFQQGLVEDVRRTVQCHDSTLLDEPTAEMPPVSVVDRRYPHDQTITPHLLALKKAMQDGASPHLLEERLYDLAGAIVESQNRMVLDSDRLTAARVATRVELFRRLHHADDLIHGSYAANITLGDIAKVACLSPYHFLRQYRLLFGVSPYQRLLARRIDAARRLLHSTEMPVTQVGLAVGFDNPGHFANTFRKTVGVSPSSYRNPHAGRTI